MNRFNGCPKNHRNGCPKNHRNGVRMLPDFPSYTSTTPIIFITANPEKVIDQVKEFSIEGLITKPFNKDDVITKIKEVIGE